jgi:hypothetical protein
VSLTQVARVHRPDLLDIVVAANLRAEEVDDDVADVDQDPIAVRQALDLGAAVAGVLEGAQQVIRHGADVTMRAPGGDDQTVGEGAFVLEIDEDDVLGLVVIQAAEDQVLERGAVLAMLAIAIMGVWGRFFVRTGRGIRGQRRLLLQGDTFCSISRRRASVRRELRKAVDEVKSYRASR